MKKLLLLLLVLSLSVTSLAGLENRSIALKFGGSLGVLDTDTSEGDEDLDLTRTLSLEYLFRFENRVDVGLAVGIEELQIKDLSTTIGIGDIDTTPVYGVLRYRFEPRGEFTPYIYGNLGYSFVDSSKEELNTDDGLYLGIGAGIEFLDNLGAEVGWSRVYLDGEYLGESIDPVGDLFKFSILMKLDH